MHGKAQSREIVGLENAQERAIPKRGEGFGPVQRFRHPLGDLRATQRVHEQPVAAMQDCERYTAHIASPATASNIWGAIDSATGGCCNSRTTDPDETGCHVYKCSAFDLGPSASVSTCARCAVGTREVDLAMDPPGVTLAPKMKTKPPRG